MEPRKKVIRIIGFQGSGRRYPQYLREDPLIIYGHVGLQFEDDPIIYGFHPTKDTIDAVGGLTLGADPIVTAVTLVSHIEGTPIDAFIVRGDMKEHGTQKAIEGCLPAKGSKVAIVEDVITKGGSALKAIVAAEAAGCRVARVIALVDRHQGGSDELRKQGYNFSAIVHADAEGAVRTD